MANMMLDCLPETSIGNDIRLKLVHQAKQVQANGLSYILNGVTYSECYFNLEPLKLKLKDYADNFNTRNESQHKELWSKGVGKEQLLLPVNIRQHYCDPEESFNPTPTFDKKNFRRELKFKHSAMNDRVEIWDKNLEGLGSDFALTGLCSMGVSAPQAYEGWAARVDLKAITVFHKMRTETDLPKLLERLNQPLNEHEVTLACNG